MKNVANIDEMDSERLESNCKNVKYIMGVACKASQ